MPPASNATTKKSCWEEGGARCHEKQSAETGCIGQGSAIISISHGLQTLLTHAPASQARTNNPEGSGQEAVLNPNLCGTPPAGVQKLG